MILIGDTVTLSVQFRDGNGEKINISNLVLTIYSENNFSNEIIETINISDEYKKDTGKYEVLYTIPDLEPQNIIFEFLGTMENGKQTLIREKEKITFV